MAFQGLNEVRIIGYVSADPEGRTTQNGKAVVSFSIPTVRKWGDKDITDWHKIVAWGKLAEIVCTYVKKGSFLCVTGANTTKVWEDKNKVKHYQAEILANAILLLPSGKKKAEEAEVEPEQDVPF